MLAAALPLLVACRVALPDPIAGNDVASVETGGTDAGGDTATAPSCEPLDLSAGGSIHVEVAAGAGGVGTETCPFGTLEAAQAAVRTWRSVSVGDVEVILGDGRWVLDETLRFGPEDSGPVGHSVTWRARNAGQAVLTSGEAVTGWTWSAAEGWWSAPVSGRVDALDVAGVTVPKSRIQTLEVGEFPYEAGAWVVQGMDPARWLDGAELEAVAYTDEGGVHCPIVAIEGQRLVLDEACDTLMLAWTSSERRHFDRIVGALEFLDTPGEFAWDPAGIVYYRPLGDEDPNVDGAWVPRLETLLEVVGTPEAPVERVRFADLHLTGTTWSRTFDRSGIVSATATYFHPDADVGDLAWEQVERPPAAFEVHGARDVAFEALWFQDVAGTALALDGGTRDAAVTDCLFSFVDGVAVIVGDARTHHLPDPAEATGAIQLTGNHVFWPGAELQDSPGVLVTYANDVKIDGNTFVTTSMAAVQLGWGFGLVDKGGNPTFGVPAAYDTATVTFGNVVSHNIFSNNSNELPRGGAVRVMGAQSAAVISDNWMIDADDGRVGMAAVLLDHGTRFVEVTRNVFDTQETAVTLVDRGPNGECGNARDNVVHGNWGTAAVSAECGLSRLDAPGTKDAQAEAVAAAAGARSGDVWWFPVLTDDWLP